MADSGGATSTRRRSRTMKRVKRVKRGRRPFVPHGLLPALGLALVTLWGLMSFPLSGVQQKAEFAAQEALSEIGADWATVKSSGQWIELSGRPPSLEAASQAANAVRASRSSTWLGRARPVTAVRTNWDLRNDVEAGASVALPSLDLGLNNPVDAMSTDANANTDANSEASPGTEFVLNAETEETTETDLFSSITDSDPAIEIASSDTGIATEWRFERRNGLLRLEGEVPSRQMRDALLAEARILETVGAVDNVEDNLEIVGRSPRTGFSATSLKALSLLRECDQGVTHFQSEELSISCELPTSKLESLRTELAADLPFGQLGEIDLLANESVALCEDNLSKLLSEMQIRFATNSSQINSISNPLLDRVADETIECPGRLRIEGHTDNVGRSSYNETLSLNRAASVRAALVQRGVPADRLLAEGFGSERPIASNQTEAGRAQNRRIEMRVIRTFE